MKICLTIPEFIAALFQLDQTICRLSPAGRITNIYGFAYQIQSLLFEKIKIFHLSYRHGSAKLGSEVFHSWTGQVSSSTARFDLDTLIKALTEITIKQPNQLSAAFGKDAAWSWRWPSLVFWFGICIFNALIAFSAPFSNGLTYWQFMTQWPAWIAMLIVGLFFQTCLSYPLRRILCDSSFFGTNFTTNYDLTVVRAEIFQRIKKLDQNKLTLGVLPDIQKLIDEDEGETSDHAIAQLLHNLQRTKLALETETIKNKDLSIKLSKSANLITSLRFQNENLRSDVKDSQHKLSLEISQHHKTNAELLFANEKLVSLEKELDKNKATYNENIASLNNEIKEYKINFSENEYVKLAKITFGILAYTESEANTNQEEYVRLFQEIHDQKIKSRGPDHFDTKLQSDTVRKSFAKVNEVARKAGMKKNWFSDPVVVNAVTNKKK